jgi:hypothetical protein
VNPWRMVQAARGPVSFIIGLVVGVILFLPFVLLWAFWPSKK